MSTLYDTQSWRDLRHRVLSDDAECALAHLAGDCRGALQLHHVAPLAEGGPAFPSNEDGLAILCAAHHAWLHAWRRRKAPQWKTCSHHHPYPGGREECERKLNSMS